MKNAEIHTYDDRKASLLVLKDARLLQGTRAHWKAHIERLQLIYRPFPAVVRVGTGSAMPWSGTIIGDTFYGNGEDTPRRRGRSIGEDEAWMVNFEREETV